MAAIAVGTGGACAEVERPATEPWRPAAGAPRLSGAEGWEPAVWRRFTALADGEWPPDAGAVGEVALRALLRHADEDTSAALANDLAVLLWLRAEVEDSAVDLLEALSWIQRAVERDPRHGVSLQTRAALLERLGLRGEAEEARRRFLQVEPDGPWSAAVRAALERGEAPAEPSLGTSPAASSDPSALREEALASLLGEWAEATIAGDEAEGAAVLDRLEERAAEAAERGDHFLADEVEALRRHGPAARGRIAGAYRDLARGRAAYRESRLEVALEALDRASSVLTGEGLPLGALAEVEAARTLFYRSPEEARRRLLEVAERDDVQQRFPWLRGRTELFLGLVAAVQHREGEAVGHYAAAARQFERAAGVAELANVRSLQGAALLQLGEEEAAWSLLLESVRVLAEEGDDFLLQSSLADVEQALVRLGRPELATPFLDELVRVSERLDSPLSAAYSYRDRAANRIALGRVEDGLADLGRARREAARLPETSRRASLEASIAIEEALAVGEGDAERALELLGEALAVERRLGRDYDQPRILTAQARAWRELERPDAAVESLEQAIALFEKRRESAQSPALRRAALEQAQPAFDQLVDLLAEHPRLAAEGSALTVAERARARFLLERRQREAGIGDATDAATPERILGALDERTTMAHFTVLEGRVLLHRARGGEMSLHAVELSRDEVAGRVRRFREEVLAGGSPDRVRAQASELGALLLGPLGEPCPGGRLVLVPDRDLETLPFAALVDPSSGRYLIESCEVVTAPSAALWATSSERRQGDRAPHADRAEGADRAAREVAVIGPPERWPEGYATLGSLPAAREEAERVARLHGGRPLLLAGADATVAATLDAVRRARIVHLATHSVLNGSLPGRSAILLQPAEGSDGVLLLDHLLDSPSSQAELVVLSSCSSALGLAVDREPFLGLTAALLAAGVETVVATLWPVDDARTRDWMVELHRRVAGGERPAAAARAASMEAIARSDEVSRWAPFAVFAGAPSPAETSKARSVSVSEGGASTIE